MKQGEGMGKPLRMLLCGLGNKANAEGAGLTDVRVAETRHGLNVQFNVAGAVLLKLDREAQGAVVSLAADTSIERDGLKLHIQTRKLADDPVKGWRTVASFTDRVGAVECYRRVYSGNATPIPARNDIRLIAESVPGGAIAEVLEGVDAGGMGIALLERP